MQMQQLPHEREKVLQTTLAASAAAISWSSCVMSESALPFHVVDLHFGVLKMQGVCS